MPAKIHVKQRYCAAPACFNPPAEHSDIWGRVRMGTRQGDVEIPLCTDHIDKLAHLVGKGALFQMSVNIDPVPAVPGS